MAAVRALAAEGTASSDADAKFAERVAGLPDEFVDPAMVRAVWEMLAAYRPHLDALGTDYDLLPVPPRADPSRTSPQGARLESKGARTTGRAAQKLVDSNGTSFVLSFPYDKDMVAETKRIRGRRYDRATKNNTAPLSAAEDVAAFAVRHRMTVTAAAERHLPDMTPPDVSEDALVPGRSVVLGSGALVMTYPDDDAALDELVKPLPGRSYSRETQTSTFPVAYGPEILDFAERHGFTVDAAAAAAVARWNRRAAELRAMSHAVDGPEPGVKMKGSLLPYQRGGVAYARETRSSIIADQMGLGKSLQGAATVEAEQAYPAAVLAPPGLLCNYANELAKFFPHRTAAICTGTKPGPCDVPAADFYVVGYSTVHAWQKVLPPLRAVVLDESHYCMNADAKRSKAAAKVAAGVRGNNGLVIEMTGTPVQSRPLEVEHQLRIAGILDQLGGASAFKMRYCDPFYNGHGWDFRGASNEEELNEKLRSIGYVRRLKTQVLKDLPPRRWATVAFDRLDLREYRRAEAELLKFLYQEAYDKAVSEGHPNPTKEAVRRKMRAASAETLVRAGVLRRLAAAAKVPAATQWIKDFLESGQKLVVFAEHREVTAAVAGAFGAPAVVGGVSAADKDAAVGSFQNDPATNVIVLSFGAGAEGLTLTAASDVLFVERAWTPTKMDQALGRCHRIGQKDSVTGWVTHAPGTKDETMVRVLDDKRDVVDATTEGETQPGDPPDGGGAPAVDEAQEAFVDSLFDDAMALHRD